MDSGGYRNYLLSIVVYWLVLEIFSLYWNKVKNMLLIFKYIIWYDYCFNYLCICNFCINIYVLVDDLNFGMIYC